MRSFAETTQMVNMEFHSVNSYQPFLKGCHQCPSQWHFYLRTEGKAQTMVVTCDKQMEGRLILLSLRVQFIVAGKAG